jgi:hypothetical protein
MPEGLIVYRGDTNHHAAVTRRDVARLLLPLAAEWFADTFNDGKHPDDAVLEPLGQEWDTAVTDVAAYNVDDLKLVVSMNPGPNGRHEARREELRMGLAVNVLDFLQKQPVQTRQHIRTIQVDVRFQVMAGLVVSVKSRTVISAWGNSSDTEFKGTTLPAAP